MMQVQVQEKKEAQDKKEEKEDTDELDLYVSLRSSLDNPFNVFVRLSDLDKDMLYFYAYSFGKKKIIIWGVYDKINNEFLIDEACQYNPNELKGILDVWKNNNYKYFFASTKDRAGPRITQEILFGDRKTSLDAYVKFKTYFLSQLASKGYVKNPVVVEDYQEILDEVAKKGFKAAQDENHEKSLNLIYSQLNQEDENKIRGMIARKDFSSSDPYMSTLAKYVLANAYILAFLDIEEYRVAKYIDYLFKNPKDPNDKRIMNIVRGKFLYEWMLELSRVLGLYNSKQFILDYTKDIIRLTETTINRTDVGVLGARDVNKILPSIEEMAMFFEDFIAKSQYSKISLTKNLPLCPTLESCQNQTCSLFEHGAKLSSQFDFT